jgi:hypothetical protein
MPAEEKRPRFGLRMLAEVTLNVCSSTDNAAMASSTKT